MSETENILEKQMAEAVLEAIDLRLKPIKDGLEELRKGLEMQRSVINKNVDIDGHNFVDLEKKVNHEFLVTARLIESVIDVIIKKHSDVRKCDDDVKGLKLLKGESY